MTEERQVHSTEEALKLALEALRMPCNRWNKTQHIKVQEAIEAAEKALAQPEREQEPVGQLLEEAYGRGQVMWFNKPDDFSMLYTTPPQRKPEQEPVANDWSVFNTGAEVVSGLSLSQAWDYLTPERLERGWSAVCVINKDNQITTSPYFPTERQRPSRSDMTWVGLTNEDVKWCDHNLHLIRWAEAKLKEKNT